MVSTDYKNLEVAEKRLTEYKISDVDKRLILKFKEQLAAEDLTIGRQVKYIYTLGRIGEMLDTDFRKANKMNITKLVAKINNNSDFKDWTKYNYLVIIRRFYKWLRQSDEYPREVKWIHPRIKQHKKTMPKTLLTVDDVKNMANATNNLRDRAFILVLYETGARIGEILGLEIKDVENDKYGAKIGLQGKTGYRKIRIISSTPAINNWLSQHPNREDENCMLFCGIGNFKKGVRLEYQSFRKVLRETAEKIGLDKPVNPHHFRHSRATELAKKLTEAQLCQYMGWKIGSKEASTYVHLSGRDIDDKILALHGLKAEEKTEEQMKPIVCPRCKTKNDYAAKFCNNCSLGLDEKSILEYDERQKQIKKAEELIGEKTIEEIIGERIHKELQKIKQELLNNQNKTV